MDPTSKPSAIILFVYMLMLFSFGLLMKYYISSNHGFDFSDHIIGRDFANIHLSGTLIGQDQIDVLFKPDQYLIELQNWLSPDYSVHNWSYPPTMFPVSEILAKFPYFTAYLLWTLGGAVLLALALRGLNLSGVWIAAIILSPAGALNLFAGQNGYYTSALLIFALHASLKYHKISAGIFWAIATVKPHLGLLALPLLIAKRRYGVIAAGTGFFLLLVGMVIYRYGIDPWVSFFEITVPNQRLVVEQWAGLLKVSVPTMFMQARLLGLPVNIAYILHVLVFSGTAALLFRAWLGPNADIRSWLTWFAVGTFLMLPYSFAYDFVLFQVVLALWADKPEEFFRIKSVQAARAIWILLWILPFASIPIAMTTNIQVVPFILLWVLWRMGCKPLPQHNLGS